MRGVSLLELLVALTCTALLAAVLLPTFVARAEIARRQASRARVSSTADAAATILAADLRRAGRWLDGATGVRRSGEVVPVVSAVPVPPDPAPSFHVRILMSLEPPREVLEAPGGGTFWVADVRGLEAGAGVVALGQPLRPASEPPPSGVIDSVWSGVEGGLVRIRWELEEAELLELWGAPERLVPVRLREYAVGESGGTRVLRRRDEGGSWQPVTDALDALRVELYADRDGDGGPDARLETDADGTAGEAVSHVVVEVEMVTAAGERIRARRWTRLPRS